ALRSTGWHYVQHVCFFGAALLFWYPVVRPYPSRPLVALAAVAVPAAGRPVEHRPVGRADVLRARAVPVLRGGAAPGRPLGPGRPVGGRRPHVGARLAGLSAAVVRDRHSPSSRGIVRAAYSVLGTRYSARRGPHGGAHTPSPGRPAPRSYRALRRAARPAAGPLPEMAPRPARPPVAPLAARRRRHL